MIGVLLFVGVLLLLLWCVDSIVGLSIQDHEPRIPITQQARRIIMRNGTKLVEIVDLVHTLEAQSFDPRQAGEPLTVDELADYQSRLVTRSEIRQLFRNRPTFTDPATKVEYRWDDLDIATPA